MVSLCQRVIDRYDPRGDASDRYPEWTIRLTNLDGLRMVVDLPAKTLTIDPRGGDGRYELAKAVAHLDLGHVDPAGGGPFTVQQKSDADGLARLRLDDPDVIPRVRAPHWLLRFLLVCVAGLLMVSLNATTLGFSPPMQRAWADAAMGVKVETDMTPEPAAKKVKKRRQTHVAAAKVSKVAKPKGKVADAKRRAASSPAPASPVDKPTVTTEATTEPSPSVAASAPALVDVSVGEDGAKVRANALGVELGVG